MGRRHSNAGPPPEGGTPTTPEPGEQPPVVSQAEESASIAAGEDARAPQEPPVIEAPVPPPIPPLRPETFRVKAKRHLGEEDLKGNLVHRVPGEVFEITFERAMALGQNLLEEAEEDEPLGPPAKKK